MTARRALVALLSFALCGCASMTKVTVDSQRLSHGEPPHATLACAYRLGDLVDARPVGASAGSMGLKAFELNDPLGVVRDQLAAAGLRADGQGRKVDVRLMQLYLAQNTITLVPVVVYQATIDGYAPLIARGQPTSMNSWGTDNEATKAYIAALRAANARLIASLNAACPGHAADATGEADPA